MSHLITIKHVLVKDLEAVRQACKRLGLKEPVYGKAMVFETELEGLLVSLDEWIFPVVCNLATGELHYDNWGGDWGEQAKLDLFIQLYGVEKARIEAEKRGVSFYEETLENGEIVAEIGEGGW